MKITVTERVTRDVDLDPDQVDQITIDNLCRRFNIPHDGFIKGDKLMTNVEYGGGSHSWDTDEVWRNVEPMDEAVLSVIDALRRKQRERRNR